MDVFKRNTTHKISNNRENETFHDAYLSPFASQMRDRYANVFVSTD